MLSAREAAAQAERAEQGEGGPNGNSSGERGDRSTPPPGSPRGAGAGDPELVRALFGKGVALGKLGRNTQAGQVLEAVLVADAGHADAMVYLAMLRLRDSRVDEGIALCRLALERDAAHALGKEVLSTALTDEGTRLKVAGFSDLAFERYAEAAQVSPGCAPARYNLGIIHADRGEVEEALRAYRAALHVRPTYAEAHNNMGVVLKGAGRIAEAVEAYRACLRVDPNFELASKNLSIALSDLGTIVKGSDEPDARARALEHYQEALFHNSKNADAMYNLGVSYCERNELAKAAVCYELTLQINPRCAEAHNNLGVIHKDLGNLPKALQSYESALRLRPTFPEALNNLGSLPRPPAPPPAPARGRRTELMRGLARLRAGGQGGVHDDVRAGRRARLLQRRPPSPAGVSRPRLRPARARQRRETRRGVAWAVVLGSVHQPGEVLPGHGRRGAGGGAVLQVHRGVPGRRQRRSQPSPRAQLLDRAHVRRGVGAALGVGARRGGGRRAARTVREFARPPRGGCAWGTSRQISTRTRWRTLRRCCCAIATPPRRM